MARSLDPFGRRNGGSIVIGASLIESNGRTVTRESYDRALHAAYVAETGRIPARIYDHEPALVAQYTYRGKGSARGQRTLESARG